MGSTYLFEGFMVSMCAVLFFSVLFFFLFVPTGTVYVVFQFGITIAFFYPRGNTLYYIGFDPFMFVIIND
jgi:hypothetical protein